jgi:hypothetical protein
MRHKWVVVLLSLTTLVAPSALTAQLPSTPSPSMAPIAPVQPSTPNPLFPAQLGLPWLGVPELGPPPPPPPQPPVTQAPSIEGTDRQHLPLPVYPGIPFHSKPVYVGKAPVLIPLLPLSPNPIASRLQSFGFLHQVPIINSPVENRGDR